jgi:diguanylate cyclase (GGDEF)-like protein
MFNIPNPLRTNVRLFASTPGSFAHTRDRRASGNRRDSPATRPSDPNSLLEIEENQPGLDKLTGLPGRARFVELAEALRLSGQLEQAAVAIVLIDLDGFKRVNDDYGHDRGDQVLLKAADALRGVLRAGDVAGRIGGDEFVACVLAPAADIDYVARAVASRIVATMAKIGDGIGCSVGLSVCKAGSANLETAISEADQAMYVAKKLGKDRYAEFGQHRFELVA